MWEQIKDILPGLGIALIMGVVVVLIGWLLPASYLVTLMVQIIAGALTVFLICESFKHEAYLELKDIAVNHF